MYSEFKMFDLPKNHSTIYLNIKQSGLALGPWSRRERDRAYGLWISDYSPAYLALFPSWNTFIHLCLTQKVDGDLHGCMRMISTTKFLFNITLEYIKSDHFLNDLVELRVIQDIKQDT